MNPMFRHDQYEKLTDNIYFLNSNLVLRMNVTLATKREDGTRNCYHQEFEYNTNKYIDTNRVITLRRSFDYYLTLENLKQSQTGEKESIMIRLQDMYHLKDKLHQISKWFLDNTYNIFVYKHNKLTILDRVTPIEIYVTGKKITFEPVVITYDQNTIEGLRVYLNSNSNYIDITVDKFMGLLYIIDTINLYQSAQIIINYLGNPGYGTNMLQFNDTTPIEERGSVNGTNNRQIPTKQNKVKSFFDN